jgi:hypothetical protein
MKRLTDLPAHFIFFHADKRTLGDCCQLAEIAAFLFSPIQDDAGRRHLGQTGDLTLFASVLLDQNVAGLRIDNKIGWSEPAGAAALRRGRKL